MGLDNGIHLITKTAIDTKSLPDGVEVSRCDWFVPEKNMEGKFMYEVCYWRKCWNIRRLILGILNPQGDSDPSEYRIESPEQVDKIRYELNQKFLFDLEGWDVDYANGDTIWSSDEMRDHLIHDAVTLSWLIDFMRNDEACRVIFYDSY